MRCNHAGKRTAMPLAQHTTTLVSPPPAPRLHIQREHRQTKRPPNPHREVSEPKSKRPRIADDYRENYRFVLPCAQTVEEFKHTKALHQEIAAAKALSRICPGTRVTHHYDTTGRSRVDGEWSCLVLNFLSDNKNECKMFRLRALFFAYEDRQQIVKLIVETIQRLAIAIQSQASAKDLWENICSFMTDAATKNLHVEEEVAKILKSQHKPIHLLCKSHTCEKLDEACINALISVENDIKIADLITKRQPQLKSFIRQNKCVAISAMKALLKLVAREESGKPTSLSKEFDLQLEEDGVAKSLSLYKERRFTKLGYSAGAILDCLKQFETILQKTTHNNLLIQACKLYIETDYICAALKSLANFTYKVTMPFLNCVERCDQNQLLPLLKDLYIDLQNGKMDTLENYHVPWKHVDMDKLKATTPLDNLLLKKMCIEAAKGIHMQCAGEYWEDRNKPRVTQLHRLTQEERKNIPTENLVCERYLARFGTLAALSASRSNKFFKAKRIRDDLMFSQVLTPDEESVSKASRSIISSLKSMEIKWTIEQKVAWTEKVHRSLAKRERSVQYEDLLLKRCKQHGGPFLSVVELENLVKKETDEKKLKASLRAEIGFKKTLHPFDAKERNHLYKMNFLTPEQLVENLTILMHNESAPSNGDELVPFPSEEEIFEVLSSCNADEDGTAYEKRSFGPQETLAVVWHIDDSSSYWCIGFYLNDFEQDCIKVDHLCCRNKQSPTDWVRPDVDDIQVVHLVQLLPVHIEGHWDFSNDRHLVYQVHNILEIQNAYECLIGSV